MSRNKRVKITSTKITPYVFIAPHVLLFVIFFVLPTIYGIYASFTRWTLFNDPVWIGLENYKTILTNTASTFYRQFWNGLKNTILFVVLTVPFQLALPLFLAILINFRPRGARLFQSVFYLPTLFSISSVTLTWLFIFNRSLGLWNNMLGTNVNWYGEQPYAWMTIIITTLWWIMGGNLIIYIAALADVDPSLVEAANIDGANVFQQFRYVTLPSIRFPLAFTLITSVISQFNIYGQPLMLTGGGPSESTFVLLMYIRNLAFGTGTSAAGMASSMAVILGLIIGIVSLFQMRLLRNRDQR